MQVFKLKTFLLGILLAVVLGGVAYSGTLKAGFHYDDTDVILNDKYITARNYQHYFDNYKTRFLVFASYILNAKQSGLKITKVSLLQKPAFLEKIPKSLEKRLSYDQEHSELVLIGLLEDKELSALGKLSGDKAWQNALTRLVELSVRNHSLDSLLPWRLTQITLHLFCVVLFMILLCLLDIYFSEPGKLKQSFVILAGCLFAIHPLCVESVNYLNARPTLFLTAGTLLGMIGAAVFFRLQKKSKTSGALFLNSLSFYICCLAGLALIGAAIAGYCNLEFFATQKKTGVFPSFYQGWSYSLLLAIGLGLLSVPLYLSKKHVAGVLLPACFKGVYPLFTAFPIFVFGGLIAFAGKQTGLIIFALGVVATAVLMFPWEKLFKKSGERRINCLSLLALATALFSVFFVFGIYYIETHPAISYELRARLGHSDITQFYKLQMKSFALYCWLAIEPVFNRHAIAWEVSYPGGAWVNYFLFYLAYLVGIILCLAKKKREMALGLILILIPLLPYLYLKSRPLIEYKAYLSAGGAAVLLALGLYQLNRINGQIFFAASFIVLSLFFYETSFRRNPIWEGGYQLSGKAWVPDTKLWENNMKVMPYNPDGYNLYGMLLLRKATTQVLPKPTRKNQEEVEKDYQALLNKAQVAFKDSIDKDELIKATGYRPASAVHQAMTNLGVLHRYRGEFYLVKGKRRKAKTEFVKASKHLKKAVLFGIEGNRRDKKPAIELIHLINDVLNKELEAWPEIMSAFLVLRRARLFNSALDAPFLSCSNNLMRSNNEALAARGLLKEIIFCQGRKKKRKQFKAAQRYCLRALSLLQAKGGLASVQISLLGYFTTQKNLKGQNKNFLDFLRKIPRSQRSYETQEFLERIK